MGIEGADKDKVVVIGDGVDAAIWILGGWWWVVLFLGGGGS